MPQTIYYILGYLFYITAILIHVLIINDKISYKLVNGGRSESYEAQAKLSKASIAILFAGIIVLFVYQAFPVVATSLISTIIMGGLTLYWILGFFMQLVGTPFERKYLSFVLLIGVFAHLMIFLQFFIS